MSMEDPDLNGGAPPVGEEIHMPAPSILPLINAAGLALAIVSLTLTWSLVATGLIIFLWSAIRWIADSLAATSVPRTSLPRSR